MNCGSILGVDLYALFFVSYKSVMLPSALISIIIMLIPSVKDGHTITKSSTVSPKATSYGTNGMKITKRDEKSISQLTFPIPGLCCSPWLWQYNLTMKSHLNKIDFCYPTHIISDWYDIICMCHIPASDTYINNIQRFIQFSHWYVAVGYEMSFHQQKQAGYHEKTQI